MEIVYILSSDLSRREKGLMVGDVWSYSLLMMPCISCRVRFPVMAMMVNSFFPDSSIQIPFLCFVPFQINDGLFAFIVYAHQFLVAVLGTDESCLFFSLAIMSGFHNLESGCYPVWRLLRLYLPLPFSCRASG